MPGVTTAQQIRTTRGAAETESCAPVWRDIKGDGFAPAASSAQLDLSQQPASPAGAREWARPLH
eukprot:2114596-Pyramimonas_sp.AAC.1